MSKRLTKLLAVVILLLTINPRDSKGQISVGGTLNYTKYLGGSTIKSAGIGLQGSYDVSDQLAVRFTFQYNFPAEMNEYTYVTAFSSATSPSQLEIPYSTTTNVMMFNFDGKKYFGNASVEDGGFYGLAGLGLALAKSKFETGSYDQSLYYSGFDATSSNTSQFYLRLFLGYEYSLSKLKLFGESGLGLAANQVNEEEVEIQLPSYFNFNIGVRLPLGN